MKKLIALLGFLLITSLGSDFGCFYGNSKAYAQQASPSSLPGGLYFTIPPVYSNKQQGIFQIDANGNLKTTQSGYTAGRATADAQIKASPGFVHEVSIAPLTATPTAGVLTVYDSLTETGTVLYSEWIFATTPGHTVILDVPAGTGIYIGFDAALANVQATVSYR